MIKHQISSKINIKRINIDVQVTDRTDNIRAVRHVSVIILTVRCT